MRYSTCLVLALAFSPNVDASQLYQCTDSQGRLIYRDSPCGERSTGKLIRTAVSAPINLSGERLDEVMWILLEEPYKSDDDKFIAHVKSYRLLHAKDRDGDTVLSIAALNEQTAVIDFLISSGVDVNNTNNRGNTVFDHAIKLSNRVRISLLHHGADINHAGEESRTPLINAVLSDDLETVRFLLAHGANIEHIDSQGGSALYYAAFMGNVEIVKALIEAGANENASTRSRPLQVALSKRHLLLSAYLSFKGATL